MSKRESGWYRVVMWGSVKHFVFEFDAENGWVDAYGDPTYTDNDFAEIGDMVMTPSGQIVYNQPAHDPLYNTKQEG
ncbi:MAG: hypothetical protein ACRC4K_14605 [Plesiomonas shigelloides]